VALCAGLAASSAECRTDPDARLNGDARLASSSADAPSHHLRVVAADPSGAVGPAVRALVDRESKEGRRLLVYVGAAWCEPCRRFHDAAVRGDLDQNFGKLTLLEYDADRDSERLAAAGYSFGLIPLFAVPSGDGTASGRQIGGSVKGENGVAFIVPRLLSLIKD